MVHQAVDQRVELVAHPEVGEAHVVQRRRDHAAQQLDGPPAGRPVEDGQRHHQQARHRQDEGQREDEGVGQAQGVVVEEAQHGQRPQDAEDAGDLQEARRLQVAPRVDLEDQDMVDARPLPAGHVGRHVQVEDEPGERAAVETHERGRVLRGRRPLPVWGREGRKAGNQATAPRRHLNHTTYN